MEASPVTLQAGDFEEEHSSAPVELKAGEFEDEASAAPARDTAAESPASTPSPKTPDVPAGATGPLPGFPARPAVDMKKPWYINGEDTPSLGQVAKGAAVAGTGIDPVAK